MFNYIGTYENLTILYPPNFRFCKLKVTKYNVEIISWEFQQKKIFNKLRDP